MRELLHPAKIFGGSRSVDEMKLGAAHVLKRKSHLYESKSTTTLTSPISYQKQTSQQPTELDMSIKCPVVKDIGSY